MAALGLFFFGFFWLRGEHFGTLQTIFEGERKAEREHSDLDRNQSAPVHQTDSLFMERFALDFKKVSLENDRIKIYKTD